MLRELQTTMNTPANAMLKSGADTVIKTGSAVVLTGDGTFELPTEATVADLYFVTKAKVPTGLNAAREYMSDYDEDFTDVKKNELAIVKTYNAGEVIATDQIDKTGLPKGSRLMAGANGKLKKATKASRYIYDGTITDAGHELARVIISDTAVENA